MKRHRERYSINQDVFQANGEIQRTGRRLKMGTIVRERERSGKTVALEGVTQMRNDIHRVLPCAH